MGSIAGIRSTIAAVAAIAVMACGMAWGAESVRYADLGDFKLDSGETIRNCRVAYMTRGTLDAEKSNAVLIPTWLAGTAEELVDLGFIGPGKIFDSGKYYIIAVESFGSGLSSSPSNSRLQPDRSFPFFTIRDMVRAQHMVLTRQLNIQHIRAVAGISMGALQAFQWMVSYPGFMDKVIPVVGGPWMTSHELLLWSAELAILDNIEACQGNTAAMKALTPLHVMSAWSPGYRVARTGPDVFPAFLAEQQEKLSHYSATNWAAQVRAILHHDIRKDFGGSAEKTAAVVRAECLVITSAQDRICYPEAAKTFARLQGARTAELKEECGHFAFLCDQENLKTIVNAFLGEAANPRTPARHAQP